MTIKSYRDLEVWRKARALVVRIYRLTGTFPKEGLYGLTSQLRRAAISECRIPNPANA
ncbi:MAG: four helix bundle protein [Alphaproteobacteria bacterium]|nr:four helix bundle protein [Alphaproteobacteria bacterium]